MTCNKSRKYRINRHICADHWHSAMRVAYIRMCMISSYTAYIRAIMPIVVQWTSIAPSRQATRGD